MIWYIVFIERIFRDCSRKIVVDDKVVPIIIGNEHDRRKFLGDYNIKGIIGRYILKNMKIIYIINIMNRFGKFF